MFFYNKNNKTPNLCLISNESSVQYLKITPNFDPKAKSQIFPSDRGDKFYSSQSIQLGTSRGINDHKFSLPPRNHHSHGTLQGKLNSLFLRDQMQIVYEADIVPCCC
jgi:hypothetical protein